MNVSAKFRKCKPNCADILQEFSKIRYKSQRCTDLYEILGKTIRLIRRLDSHYFYIILFFGDWVTRSHYRLAYVVVQFFLNTWKKNEKRTKFDLVPR